MLKDTEANVGRQHKKGRRFEEAITREQGFFVGVGEIEKERRNGI